jgi:hypothetical protein
MKPNSHAEMHEGQEAFDRFRKAMKTIATVRKQEAKDKSKPAPSRKKRTTKT